MFILQAIMSLLLCFAWRLLHFSMLWITMAKGSKFIQEAHEAQVLKYNELECLFCDLGKYQNGDYDTKSLKQADKISFWNPLKSYRFSPSKINIALGYTSLLFATILLVFHILYGLDFAKNIWGYIKAYKTWIVIIGVLTFVVALFLGTYFLKGSNKKLSNNQV